MYLRLLFAGLVLFGAQAQAQNLMLFGASPSYSQMGKLSNKWAYSFNASSVIDAFDQTVEGKFFPATHTHFVVQGLGVYQINKQWTLGVGAGYGRHNIFWLRENEPRLLAQTTYQHKVGKWIFTHRARYESRHPINLKTGVRSSADIGRYQVWATLPLYDPAKQKQGYFLSASNEAFLYFKGATNGPVSSRNGSIFSENWTHLGGGYNTGNTRIEAAYCFQALVRNKPQDYRFFNLLQLNIYHTINWHDVQYWWYF
ncbi:MAG: DUF2490 domain-containing protein [Runella slithyformis]|nr:MAG: DUF2490 domain-containing protein [Runella slithyformis]